jgi:hypothetical protein
MDGVRAWRKLQGESTKNPLPLSSLLQSHYTFPPDALDGIQREDNVRQRIGWTTDHPSIASFLPLAVSTTTALVPDWLLLSDRWAIPQVFDRGLF